MYYQEVFIYEHFYIVYIYLMIRSNRKEPVIFDRTFEYKYASDVKYETIE
jgi:hypothetical protein